RPLVLVSFSTTFQNHLGPLQRVIDALATLPVKAVVTLGGSIYADEVEPAPNVALLGSAPHAPIMAEAAVVVCHGGHGTVMKALAAGRPMLVIPHGRDQNDNAARVAERGAGIVLPPLASAAEIAHAVRRILAEPGFAASAARLGADVRREAAETPVFAMLEGLAACGTLRRAA
ncbi:MAG: glycosyltransferase, partial [Alphaproteobacteria bacterium]